MLDSHEQRALSEFLLILREERFDPEPRVDEAHVVRGPGGELVVPLVVDATEPSLHIAMLMSHKAEQLYKQTGCRFIVAQHLQGDPKNLYYVLSNGSWTTLQ